MKKIISIILIIIMCSIPFYAEASTSSGGDTVDEVMKGAEDFLNVGSSTRFRRSEITQYFEFLV